MRRHPLRAPSVRKIKPTVERMEGRVLLAAFLVSNTNDDTNSGSLRFAIAESDATPGSNSITFNIAGTGVQTIAILSALPAITVPVTIDGTTQTGYNGTPLVELDGAGAGAGADGLDVQAGGTTIKGLAINRFTGEGINLSVAGNDLVQFDFLGTDPTGTIARGNALDGVLVQAGSNNNTISGNVISSNTDNGINLNGTVPAGATPPSTSGNLIIGNFLGTDVTGQVILGNTNDGVELQDAPMNTIGGTSSATRNVISGNGTGVALNASSDDSVIEGNLIGTDATGTKPLGNKGGGVAVSGGSNVTVGGTTSGAGNVISDNGADGIRGLTPGLVVQGNLVGTDITGTLPLGNKGAGVYSLGGTSTATIGGTVAGAANVIADNQQDGIVVQGVVTGALIQGNFIGTDITGTLPLGDGGYGILVLGSQSSTTIGGSAAGSGNVISDNTTGGILSQGSTGTLIEGNFIGTDLAGIEAIGNKAFGIFFLGGTGTIGGTVAGAGNVVSSNTSDGISLQGTTVLVEGNSIGTDASGTLPLGNGSSGVNVFASTATIGGLAAGAGNIIANNGATGQNNMDSGITVGDSAPLFATILSNSIFNNQLLGINYQVGPVSPVLSSATSSATMSTVAGTLTAADGTYTLQFFATPTLNPSGNAEGKTLLGTAVLTVTGGMASFTDSFATPFADGELITATATDSLGTTSDFSSPFVGQQTPLPPTLSVESSSPSVPVGQAVLDTFTITNPSRSAAEAGLVFTDTIAAGVNFISGMTSTGAIVVFSGGVATADLGTLAAGQSVTVTIALSPTVAAEPSFTDTGEVTTTTPPVTSGSITASATISVTPSADLSVTIAGPTGTAAIGLPFVYTVTATNNGPSPASGILINDVLPGALTFVSVISSSGQVPSEMGGVITELLGSLAAGASEILTITVIPTASAAPSVADSASVAGNESDPNPANNTATIVTNVMAEADLAITGETITPGPVAVGQLVTITIVVANKGPSTATGVNVLDMLPAGLTFLSGTADGGAAFLSGGVVTAPIGTILDGGTSVVTILAMTTMAGTISDGSMVSGSVTDPDPTNNTGGATVVVTASADLSIALSGPAGPNYTNSPSTYTAVVTNNGPTAATNALFVDPLFAGASFVAVEANGVFGSVVSGVVELPLGTIAAGASVTVILIVTPTLPGTITDTGFVTSDTPDPDLANNSSSVSTAVVVPMSLVTFSAPAYVVANNAGFVAITLVRSGYDADNVTVHFSTPGGGGAVPGVDYQPVDEIVEIPAGATQVVVDVPILEDNFENHNPVLVLQLDTPTGSAVVEPDPTNATVTIVDVSPVLVGPTVTALKLTGYLNSITAIEVDTTGNLSPSTANDPSNYILTAIASSAKGALPNGAVVPLTSAVYVAATGAVFLTPAISLPGDQLFLITVRGTGPNPVSDLAGNPLNSVLGSIPGSDYLMTFARGTQITYSDEHDDLVTLKLTGPGTIDIDRFVAGNVDILQVVGGVSGKTVITGAVHPTSPRTTIDSILGIGKFGSIRVKLTTPAFYVVNTVFPNNDAVDAPAIDTLLPTPATVTKSKTTKTKTTSTSSKKSHVAPAHAASVHVAKAHPAKAHPAKAGHGK